jgi:hypothetical protein
LRALRRVGGLPRACLTCRLWPRWSRSGTRDRPVQRKIAQLGRADKVIPDRRVRLLLRRILGERRRSREKQAGRSRDNDPQARRHDPQAID